MKLELKKEIIGYISSDDDFKLYPFETLVYYIENEELAQSPMFRLE